MKKYLKCTGEKCLDFFPPEMAVNNLFDVKTHLNDGGQIKQFDWR